MSTDIPYVSIVTPVHNGEKYLKECIESVLSQTYQNWEYIIQNNFSNDDTLEIARHYAKKDKRIKIYNTEKLLLAIDNWNDVLRKISPYSEYCKVIHADDLLYSECIEKMIQIAIPNKNVGIVGSYALIGNNVKFEGLPKDKVIISGKELCRLTLKKQMFLFGSPSNLLIRSDIINSYKNFYNNRFIHADTEVCYKILRHHDFGFVHQILSYTRLHQDSQTELVSNKYNTNIIEYLAMLKKYGPIYLEKKEYLWLVRNRTKRYYREVAQNLFRSQGRDIIQFHRKRLEKFGIKFCNKNLFKAIILEIIDLLFNPKRTISAMMRHKKISYMNKMI